MTVTNTKKLTKTDVTANEPTPPAGDVVVIEPQGRDRERRNGFFVAPFEVHVVPATEVTLPQDRTKKVPLPERFHLEADPAKVKKHKGHQVDPSRAEGCAPVMPNLALLQATGNPYPKAADETVETADQYKPFVLISHLTYERLKAKGEVYSADQAAIDAVLAEASVASTFDSRTAVIDTLRDLALYGVVAQFRAGRARLFRPVV